MSLPVDRLWRYPVKSLAGEPLENAQLKHDGIAGDRIVHVRGPEGVRTSRRHHRLLGLHGTLDADRTPQIDGRHWDSRRALALFRAAAGNDAWLATDGIHGLDERTWPGADLHIGAAIVRLDSLRPRCPMTTVDPDTLERDPEVLRDIGRRFRGQLALNADFVRPGLIRVGDPVRLVRARDADAAGITTRMGFGGP